MRPIIGLLIVILFALPITAQTQYTVDTYTLDAPDGQTLVGDLIVPIHEETDPPIIITLHMLGGHRGAFEPIIPDLMDAGYVVLNLDMRGHGDTGGAQDWDLAMDDLSLWVTWLREQSVLGEQDLFIVGGSIGANVALISCADIADCDGAIALSPGLDYQGVEPESSVVEGLADRPLLLVASHADLVSATAVTQMFTNTMGDVTARLYTGGSHGTNLFRTDYDSISTLMLGWLHSAWSE